MLRIAQLEIRRTRNRGARIDQIRRIEDAGAVLALIAAGPLVTTVGAGADNVAIGKETFVVDRIDLSRSSLLQQTILIELMIEGLRDPMVLGRTRAAEVIKGKAEAVAEILLDRMHPGAIVIDRKASLMR